MSVMCFCGSTASLKSNKLIYGREYGNGKIWLCDRFPACRGSVGTHPDGRPLGTIPDAETKKLRIKVHAMIDPLWKNEFGKKRDNKIRGYVYGWLRRITGKNHDECHIGMFTKEDCLRTIELIKQEPFEDRRKNGKSGKSGVVLLREGDAVQASCGEAQASSEEKADAVQR